MSGGARGASPAASSLAALLAVLAGCERVPQTSPPDQAGAAEARGAPLELSFEDATERAGLSFVHVTGGTGEKLLPETMGSGACFLDYDADGHLDLFLVNSCHWPGSAGEGQGGASCALYRGRGDGTFVDVSREAGLDLVLYGMGASAADYDGDGDEDLYVTSLADNLLLENQGGRFLDVTAQAGVGGGRWSDASGQDHPEWSTASAWFDADVDGDLDLFVANYVQWTRETEIFTTLDGVHKAFTTPDRYVGLPCRLFLNRGDGTFAEGPLADEGAAPLRGKGLGAALWDFDGDGGLEVAVANDTRPNFFFQNLGGGRFEERGTTLGLAYDEDGRARAGLGIDVADLGNGGGVVVAIGNFAGEPLSLYRATSGGHFRSEAAAAGLGQPTVAPLTFGLSFLDLDLDGRLDLVVVNGHIEPDIHLSRPGETHAQPAQLFRGLPGGRFEDASTRVGADFAAPRVGRGLAAGDVDHDGDLDLVITSNGGRVALLVNRAQELRRRHYVAVELEGEPGNRRALGAAIALTAGGRTQRRLVRTGSSYLSQSALACTFGLGGSTAVDALEVRWPDGTCERFDAPAVDRTLRLVRGTGQPAHRE